MRNRQRINNSDLNRLRQVSPFIRVSTRYINSTKENVHLAKKLALNNTREVPSAKKSYNESFAKLSKVLREVTLRYFENTL